MTQQTSLFRPSTARLPLPLKDWPGLTGGMRAFEVGPTLWPAEYLTGPVDSFDSIGEIPSEETFNQGVVTLALADLPARLFEVMRPKGRLLFILNTSLGEILFVVERQEDHFRVLKKICGHFAPHTNEETEHFANDLSELYQLEGNITIWPQGSMNLTGHLVVGRDMVFEVE